MMEPCKIAEILDAALTVNDDDSARVACFFYFPTHCTVMINRDESRSEFSDYTAYEDGSYEKESCREKEKPVRERFKNLDEFLRSIRKEFT